MQVEPGFSGAPVWSPDLGAFVGLVVTEQKAKGLSWCIPSRSLCDFYNDLKVKFRIHRNDRPEVHDYEEDDPNSWIFGGLSDDGFRRLTAKIRKNRDPDYDDEFRADIFYECLPGSPPPRGKYVTFVTHSDFEQDDVDSYELFSVVETPRKKGANPTARTWIYLDEGFTVAAIGDAGDTVLTLDLSQVPKRPKKFK